MIVIFYGDGGNEVFGDVVFLHVVSGHESIEAGEGYA